MAAHRGASGYRPEHTLAAYALGIEMGADAIELDLVPTRDGVLVARHENEISGTTDVADRPEFARRRTTREIDGQELTGWFTEDFTLAELQTLRARERLPVLRPANTAYDGRYLVPTLDEVLDLWAAARAERPDLGILLELKHCAHFAASGLDIEPLLVAALDRHGLHEPDCGAVVMCFETGILRRLAERVRLPLKQLYEQAHLRPADLLGTADVRTFADLVTPDGLAEVASYADGIGVHKQLVLPRDRSGRSQAPTTLVADAAAVGLPVHVWTLRRENAFLPLERRSSRDRAQIGDLAGEARDFVDAGVVGLITDNPDELVASIGHERHG